MWLTNTPEDLQHNCEMDTTCEKCKREICLSLQYVVSIDGLTFCEDCGNTILGGSKSDIIKASGIAFEDLTYKQTKRDML